MGIEDLIQARPGEHSLGSGRLDNPMEYWGPPLAPAATRGSDHLVQEQEEGSAIRDERPLRMAKKNYYAQIAARLQPHELLIAATKIQPHQLLIAASVLVGTFGIAALAYIGSSAGEKVVAASQHAAAQSAPEGSGQRAVSVSAADPSVAVAWPDLPASATTETPDVGASAPNAKTAVQVTGSAAPKEEIVFLQRPGVHLRSLPSTNGRVLATAPKGTRFKVTNREGDWVQVESDRFSGWIRSRFLAANEP